MNQLRIAVVIASVGRPAEVAFLVNHLRHQTRGFHRLVVSVSGPNDLPEGGLPADVQVVTGEKGLTKQRNRAIEAVRADSDLIAFFDDDYVPSRRALEGIDRLFTSHPDVAGADGLILADGITNGQQISTEDAVAIIERYDAAFSEFGGIGHGAIGLYGCNMVFRVAAIKDTRFDERLPLYAWQEDIDFASQLRAEGRIVKTHAFAGVHRGVTRGRQSGVRLGYSQIANPLYLARKGTMAWSYAVRLLLRNFAANLAKSAWPEPNVDRRGRTKGNLIALLDVFLQKDSPDRILEL